MQTLIRSNWFDFLPSHKFLILAHPGHQTILGVIVHHNLVAPEAEGLLVILVSRLLLQYDIVVFAEGRRTMGSRIPELVERLAPQDV